MKSPRVSAVISLVAVLLMGSSIFFSSEAPSPTVMALQWLFLFGSAIGLASSLIRIVNRR